MLNCEGASNIPLSVKQGSGLRRCSEKKKYDDKQGRDNRIFKKVASVSIQNVNVFYMATHLVKQ